MLKHILYVLALLALLAVPALGAPGSDTWTNGNSDREWDEPLNWDGGDIPGDGHTARFASVVDMPNANLPAAVTINFNFEAEITATIADMLGAGSAIGDVDIYAPGNVVTTGANVGGTVHVCTGTLVVSDGTTITGVITLDGDYSHLSVPAGTTGTTIGLLSLSNGAILSVGAGAVLNANGGILLATPNECSINNAGEIKGWVDADEYSIIWTGTGTITVDEDGTLDLGADADNDQAVTVTAETVTIGDSFRCDSFTLNATTGTPVLTGGGMTITVGTGGCTRTAGALDGVGTLNITFAETTSVCNWDSWTSRLGTVTFSGTTTAGGNVWCQKVAGDGTIAGNAKELALRPIADDFWTLSTESDGWTYSEGVRLYVAANRSNATLIDVGSSPFVHYYYARTLTLTGGLKCGALTIKNSGGAATLDMNGGNLSCSTFTFFNDSGTLLLGEGDAVFTGAITREAAETGCSIDCETAHVTLGGNVTLAGIAADFGSARIDTGAVSITGTDAAGISNAGAIVTGRTGAVTFTDMDTNWTAGNPAIFARRWTDGTGNGVRVKTLAPHWMVGLR